MDTERFSTKRAIKDAAVFGMTDEGKVDLVLPNHKLENTIKLTDHLQKLGIVEEKCKTLRIFPVSPAMWTSMCPPSCRRLSLR